MREENFNFDDDLGGMFEDEDLSPESQDDVETAKLDEDAAETEFDEEAEEEAASNRTFVLLAGGLGLLVLLTLCLIGGWALILRPRQAAQRNAQATSIMLTNTALAATLTQTALATPGAGGGAGEASPTPEATAGAGAAGGQASPTAPLDTPTPMPPTVTPTPVPPTPTPVVYEASPTPAVVAGGQASPTPLINPTSIAATATAIAAAATQQAGSGALPETGLADGLWTSPLGLALLAGVLILVIVAARRARRA